MKPWKSKESPANEFNHTASFDISFHNSFSEEFSKLKKSSCNKEVKTSGVKSNEVEAGFGTGIITPSSCFLINPSMSPLKSNEDISFSNCTLLRLAGWLPRFLIFVKICNAWSKCSQVCEWTPNAALKMISVAADVNRYSLSMYPNKATMLSGISDHSDLIRLMDPWNDELKRTMIGLEYWPRSMYLLSLLLVLSCLAAKWNSNGLTERLMADQYSDMIFVTRREICSSLAEKSGLRNFDIRSLVEEPRPWQFGRALIRSSSRIGGAAVSPVQIVGCTKVHFPHSEDQQHFTKPNCLDDGIGMPDIQPVVNPSQILLDDPFVEEVETAVIVLDERVNKKHRVGIRR
ncbi:hypothetical protein WICPIJ_009059 [Wickerhamomyces pijperi]|uniref:Uncharacterized protein n=1 Tax=Wickerhamomyces pijperi TaxID=599730 RepID=A0A9P8PQF7_WICPI|nr:hypothetical protein WICPIJ_009059 [Wickerhamomyces pijperi]